MKNKYFEIIEKFLRDVDEVSRNNANFIYSVPVMDIALSGAVSKDFLFEVIYEGLPVKALHEEGWIYHHQTYKLSAYCIGLSAVSLAMHGLRSKATNERRASPPKRLDTLFNQSANFICLISQEVSGATSLNDLSTVAASYLFVLEEKGKKYDHYDLVNLWQSFLYNVNLPFRAGNSPFSNITLDFGKPHDRLENHPVYYAGEIYKDLTYRDIPPEYYDRINMAFIDAMYQGDADGRPFTFPLITVNVDESFNWSNKAFRELLRKSKYFGGFYIQNYMKKPFENSDYKKFNPFLKPFDKGTIYSNCCRVTFDLSAIEAVTGSNPFHSGAGVGGVGVFAINMNRILMLSKDNFDLATDFLTWLLEVGAAALQRKRKWLDKVWDRWYPYLSYYQPDTRSLFNILSVVGVHEGMINAGFEGGLKNDRAKEYAHRLAQFILEKIEYFMKRDKCLYCLEYAPSETAAVDMFNKDQVFKEVVKDPEKHHGRFSKDPVINDLIIKALFD